MAKNVITLQGFSLKQRNKNYKLWSIYFIALDLQGSSESHKFRKEIAV